MNKILAAGFGLIGLAAIGTAQAAPSLSVQVFEDNVLVGGLSQSTNTGSLSASGATPNFNVSASATGAPLLAEPALLAQTTTVSALDFTGSHTIRIEFTQTGLTSELAGGLFASLASTFTSNFLVNGQLIEDITLTNYVSADNVAFGRDEQIATQTWSDGPTNASPAIVANVELPNQLFSETVVITATFTGGQAGLQASSQIVKVPEPASLALFGTALLGMGLVRRVRRKG
ncbi:PEP-CTERM sorting domain-containing protein [Falsiroseomonas sp.]|uniref:PEP-CTERM sorting domain-containing protein n=1 Tax=Falsiroseomonas sp. TaxID=2870721 RepID=UPI003F702109